MKLRRNCFGVLALVMFVVLVLLLLAQLGSSPDSEVQNKDAFRCGQGVGATMIFCVALPIILATALMSWRNSVGMATERRHREHMAAISHDHSANSTK